MMALKKFQFNIELAVGWIFGIISLLYFFMFHSRYKDNNNFLDQGDKLVEPEEEQQDEEDEEVEEEDEETGSEGNLEKLRRNDIFLI
jgi:hypothetical protein